MDQNAANFFKTSYDAFVADGGKVDGIVEWIGDAAEAEKVRSVRVFSSVDRSRRWSAHAL